MVQGGNDWMVWIHVLLNFMSPGHGCLWLGTTSKSWGKGEAVISSFTRLLAKEDCVYSLSGNIYPDWRDNSHYIASFTPWEHSETVTDIPIPSHGLECYGSAALLSARSTSGGVYNNLKFKIALLNEEQIQADKILNIFLSCSWLHFYGNMDHYPTPNLFNNDIKKHVYFDFLHWKESTN